MKHVLFFTSELGGGGAEKHLLRVANHLPRERFRTTIAVARGGGAYEADVAPDTPVLPLGGGATHRAGPALRRLLARERPDLVCSVLDMPNILLLGAAATLRNRPAVIACVQNPPLTQFANSGGIRPRMRVAAMRLAYPRADAVIALTEGVRRDLLQLAPALKDRATVVFNAGFDSGVARLAAEPEPEIASSEGRRLVACGRLVPQKGFDSLIRALARVRERVDARLWLVGDGPLRKELEAEAVRAGVRDAVRFVGFQRNPYRYMGAADAFVLSSRWEGFGNVIVESLAVGTPVVATDCPYGPREILRAEEGGLLVEPGSDGALAEGILRMLEEPGLRDRLAVAGIRRASDFSPDAVADEYGRVFDAVLAGTFTVSVPPAGVASHPPLPDRTG